MNWKVNDLFDPSKEENIKSDTEAVLEGEVTNTSVNENSVNLTVKDSKRFCTIVVEPPLMENNKQKNMPHFLPNFNERTIKVLKFPTDQIDSENKTFTVIFENIEILEKEVSENKILPALVYIKESNTYAPKIGERKLPGQVKPFFPEGKGGLAIYLICTQTEGQGEFDFLSHLHPHIWIAIEKHRVNMKDGTSIERGMSYTKIPPWANCLCIIVGGGSHIKNFKIDKLYEKIKKIREKRPNLFIVTGIGHTNDYICFGESVDYNATTPTDAARYLNACFGKTLWTEDVVKMQGERL